MVEFVLGMKKDIGLQRQVMDALPYAVVGDTWMSSFDSPKDEYTALNHIVPAGQQLKILFLRVWSQEAGGAVFSIEQTNPATGEDGNPVVGSVPEGIRDYPMLEDAGAEALRGSLEDPVHVLEGSIDFNVLNTPTPSTGSRYGIAWWGVEKVPEPKR